MNKSNLRYVTVSENDASCSKKEMDDSKTASEALGLSWGLYYCYICNVSGSGFLIYQDHLDGELHLKNLLRVEMMKCDAKKGKDRKSGVKEERKPSLLTTHHGYQFGKVSPSNNLSKSPFCTPQDKYSLHLCKICNVKISGRIPFLKHLVSKEHQKKEQKKISDDKSGVTGLDNYSNIPGSMDQQHNIGIRGQLDGLKSLESVKLLKSNAIKKKGENDENEENKPNNAQAPYGCQKDCSYVNDPSSEKKPPMPFCKSASLVSFVRSICEDKSRNLVPDRHHLRSLPCGDNLCRTEPPNILVSPVNRKRSARHPVSYTQHAMGKYHHKKKIFDVASPRSRVRKIRHRRKIPHCSANIIVKR